MVIIPPQVEAALSLLNGAGYEGYLVGGAVRDYVRGQSPHDWDIATNALPQQIKAAFSRFRFVETGIKHGTITVWMDHCPLEITTYRIDGPYSVHRRPDSVCFTPNLRDDLTRRDFTINALAYHPREGIVDLVGGLADLRAGLIRCVGDPDRRFREDALRILRALRFASLYGMDLEPHTAAAMHRTRELLSTIAPERIQTELTRTLCGPNAASVLRQYADIFSVPLPELVPMFGFCQRNPHHDKDVWLHTVTVTAAAPADPVLRWAALLHDVGKPSCFSIDPEGIGHFYGHAERSTALADSILRRLRFDTAGRERIVQLIRYHDLPITGEKKQLRRLLSKLGEDSLRQLLQLHRADASGQSALCRSRIALFEQAQLTLDELLQAETCFSLRDLAVNGRDMMELGLSGPAVGRALRICLNAVLEEQVPNNPPVLLALVRRFF